MAERSLLIRVRVVDADKAVAELRKLGIEGEKAGTGLGRGTDLGTRALTGLGQGLQRLDRGLLSTRNLIGLVAGGGGIGLLVKNALSAADALEETATQLGVSTDQLQAWRFGFGQAGTDVASLESGLDFLNRKLGEAAAGTGEAGKVFAELGIPIKNLDGATRGAGEALPDLADAIQKIESPADRARVAMALFGRGAGTEFALGLAQGARGLAEMERVAKSLGLVMAADLIVRAGAANDQLAAIGAVLKTNFNEGLIRGFIDGFAEFHAAATDPELVRSVHDLGFAIGGAVDQLIKHHDKILRVLAALKLAAGFSRFGSFVGGGPGAVVGGAVGGAIGLFAPEIFSEFIGGAEDAKARLAELNEEIVKFQEQQRRTLDLRAEAIGKAAGISVEGKQILADLDRQFVQTGEQLNQLLAERESLEKQLRIEARLKAPGPRLAGRAGVDPLSVPDPSASAKASADKRDAEANRAFIESLRFEAEALLLRDRARAIAEAGRRLNAAATAEERREVEALAGVLFTTATAREADAEARRNQLGDQALVAGLEDELRLLRLSEPAREIEIALRGLSAEATERQIDKVRTLAAALFLERKVQEDAARADEEMRRQEEEATRRVEDAARALGLTFSSAFEDAIVEGKALSDVLKGLEQDIMRILARKLVTEKLDDLFTGIAKDLAGGFGGLFGGGSGAVPLPGDAAFAGIYHKGGVVGRDGTARAVDPSWFANAPRFHDGISMAAPRLLRDEVPAILQRGEVVLSRRDVASAKRGARDEPPRVNQTINITTPDAVSFRKSQTQVAADAMAMLRRGMRNL